MLTNLSIKRLVTGGFLSLKYTSLGPKSAYNVFRFIKEIRTKNTEYQDDTTALAKSLSEEDLNKAKNYEDSAKNPTEDNNLPSFNEEDYNNYMSKVADMFKQLDFQEIKIDLDKISFEDYFKLKQENPEILDNYVDAILENELWHNCEGKEDS